MNREKEIKVIINELVKLKNIIEAEDKLNLTDKNIFLEDIMCQIINIIYDISLKNINLYISNYPCIDLLDKDKKIAFQVTTNVSHCKIQNTLDNFFNNECEKEIKKIKFIVFQNTTYRGKFSIKKDFEFNYEEDIITFSKLLAEIKSLDDFKLSKLYDYINVALVKNVYTTNWMIEETKKSLNNLGKRYNKKLNVYNDEEEKLDAFFIEKDVKQKVLNLIIDIIVNIENNGIYTKINIDDLNKNFSFELIESIKKKLQDCKNKVMDKKKQYNQKIEFEMEYDKKIKKIDFLINIFKQKTLIYIGEAGIGKSHTLANFIYEYYLSKNEPALLLLGQDFTNSENIEIQMMHNLNCQNNLKKVCEYINNIAVLRNINIPIIIDGINESKDKEIWKRGLNNFIRIITSFTNLKLILSLRETYYKLCISEEIEKIDGVKIIRHNGFSTRNFEAAKEFFEFYNIAIPITQVINREFNNPLFLSVYCEILSKYKIDIDKFKYDNFICIYDEYLKKVNEVIINKYEIPTNKNIIKECLYAISKDSINKNKYNTYEDVLNSIKDIANLYDMKKTTLLNELINNGILFKEQRNEEEILIFTFERYEKISKAEYLLSNINNVEQLSHEINDGFLHNYFDISNKFDNGILEELLIIIPMKFKKDIFQIVDLEKIKSIYYLEYDYINSLIWIKNYYSADIIVSNIKKLIEKDYREQIIDILIKCSYIYDNPCNVNLLHEHLSKLSMPELDLKWTIIIENYYDNYTNETINNLINYCLKYGNEHLDDETISLMAKVLSWLLSSNNRGLRDKSTKALVRILLNRNNICIELLDKFKDVKDIYILERIVAVMYGVIIRGNENKNVNQLADKIYEFIYKRDIILDNIVIKIYVKKIFKFLKDKFGIPFYDQMDKERKSEWYKDLPNNAEIDKKYSFTNDECSKDDRKYANLAIIHSMVTEYGRGVSAYGDFGRYTLELMLTPFKYAFDDVQLLANVATKRVFEYGYDYKIFGEYDNAIKRYQIRSENYIERIGKKYQWIATFELLSKLYDNFIPQYSIDADTVIDLTKRKYYDKNHIETRDKSKIAFVEYNLEEEYPHVIFLDTTNFILKQDNNDKYLKEKEFNFEEEIYDKYIVKDFFGKKYISLFNLYSKENRKIISKLINRKALIISQTAFIYKDKGELDKSDFHKFSQGTYCELFNIELFDIPFSSRYLSEISYNKEYFDMSKGYKICYQEYIWEQYQDDSIEETIKILLPAKWLIEEFKLIQKSEGKWYNEDDLVCFDSGVDGLETGLWIRYDYLIRYLNKNSFNIGWTIYSEKSSNKINKSWRSDVFANNGLTEFEEVNYDKEEWKSNFFI